MTSTFRSFGTRWAAMWIPKNPTTMRVKAATVLINPSSFGIPWGEDSASLAFISRWRTEHSGEQNVPCGEMIEQALQIGTWH